MGQSNSGLDIISVPRIPQGGAESIVQQESPFLDSPSEGLGPWLSGRASA